MRSPALQCVDKALLSGASSLVPLKDASVLEHMPKDSADLFTQNCLHALGREFIFVPRVELACPSGVVLAETIALERVEIVCE